MWNIPCLSDLKKSHLIQKVPGTSASILKHQIAPYNSRFTFQKMTQTLSYLFMKISFCSSACALYCGHYQSKPFRKHWENGISPLVHEPAWYYYTLTASFQFLLHTYLCMFIRFGFFSPFLPLKKMELFLSGCDQWKTIYSGLKEI